MSEGPKAMTPVGSTDEVSADRAGQAQAAEPLSDSNAQPGPELSKAQRGWKLTLLLVGVASVAAVAAIGAALTPSLLAHQPLLLIAMNPSIPHLVTVSPNTDLTLFMLVAFTRLIISDPLYFAMGRWFGPDAVAWAQRRSPGAAESLRWLEGVFKKGGSLMVFLSPYPMICLMAGVSKMDIRRFWLLNAAGTLSLLVVLRAFGQSLATPIGKLTGWVDQNSSWLTYVVVGGLVLVMVLRALRRKPDARNRETEIPLD